MAWHLVRLMVNHALDFDLSVLPGSYTSFYASQVNAAAWSALEAAVGFLLPDSVREHAKLPRALGGLAVHDPDQLIDLSRGEGLTQQEWTPPRRWPLRQKPKRMERERRLCRRL